MKIYIDIGHGGSDSGALCVDGRLEKDLTLTTGLYLKAALERCGQTVKCSRLDDTAIGGNANDNINKSAALANSWGAELVLSVHYNSSDNKEAKGVQVIYDVKNTARELAEKIAAEFVKAGQPLNATYSRAGSGGDDYYGIIRMTKAKSVIIECAFCSNESDIRAVDDARMKVFAEAICKAAAKELGFEYIKESGENIMYRVRKTWADEKSQKGAYTILENAKKTANANPGYFVFDESGKAIYPAAAPEADYEKLYKEAQAEIATLSAELAQTESRISAARKALG